MRPDDGGVHEGAGVIDFDGELLEEPLPDAALRPPCKPVVDGLPGAEPLGKIAPGNAGPDSPDDRVDELPVTALGPRSRLSGQQGLDPLPLHVTQFVSAHAQC